MCSQGSLYTSPNLNRCEALPSPYLPPSLPFSISLSSFSLPLPSLFSLCYPFLSYLLAPSQIFGSCEARRLEWQPSVTPPVEEEAVSKLQLHKDNPPDTPPDHHGDPLLTPEVSGGEETASETQIEGREETPLWPQQPRNDPLCCEKRSSPEHQEDTPLPQCESKTATDSSRGEILCCEKRSSPEHQEDTPLPQCESKTATDSSRGEILCCEKRSSPEHQEDTPLPQCESKTATDSSRGEILCCEKRSSPEHQEDTPLPQCESKTATDSSRGEILCCEKRSSPEHQEDTPLPQCESKTATDSSRGEVPLQMLESRRDPSLELQLKKLFDSTKSLTAKENLLLSLRYCLHFPSSLPLTPLPLFLPLTPPPHLPSPLPLPLPPHTSSGGKQRVG